MTASIAGNLTDQVLTKVVTDQAEQKMAGLVLFPAVPVDSRTGNRIEFDRGSFKLYNSKRAPGALVQQFGFVVEGKPYQLDSRDLDAIVPREFHNDQNMPPAADLGVRATKLAMRGLLLEREAAQAAIATNPANYPDANKVVLPAGAKWSNDNIDPTDAIDAGADAIRKKIGVRPNVGVVGAQVWARLRKHPKLRAQFKGMSEGELPSRVTQTQIAALFGLERLEIGESVSLPGNDPKAELTDLWGNLVVLAYAPQEPIGREEPSYGYTYTLKDHPQVEQARWIGDRRSWAYGVGYHYQPQLTGMDAGYLITNCV